MIKLKVIPIDEIMKANLPEIEIDKDILDQALFILIPVGMVLVLVFITLSLALCKFKAIQAKLRKTKDNLLWNGILRSLFIGYLGYATTVFKTKGIAELKFNKFCVFLNLASIITFLPIWMGFFLLKTPKEKMIEESWLKKFSTLVNGI